jgi:nitrile hydratase subunit alpha
MSHGHDHDHEHDRTDHLTEIDARVLALESLLIERGLLTTDQVDEAIAHYERDVGPLIGAKVVAKAWTDPAFKERLLADGTAAIEELGISTTWTHAPAERRHPLTLIAVENGPDVHNVVVCTLCSCYPWFLLGLPPRWYKSDQYRSRVVREPRAVLAEFGVTLSEDTAVRVRDSTSELRFLVVPRRPAGTEGWSEDELAAIVSRDSMIGTAHPVAG